MKNLHNRVWVKCPKCSGKGLVEEIKEISIKTKKSGWELPYTVSKFSCCSCGYSLSNMDKDGTIKETWHSKFKFSILNENKCISCGVKNTLNIPSYFVPKNDFEKANLKCNGCSETREYIISSEPEFWNKLGVDKYFGLDLFYQKNIKGNILWVLNTEHLQFLKSYLSKKIRKTDTHHSTPENNLPSFIINGKNKESILNYLSKIEKNIKNNDVS